MLHASLLEGAYPFVTSSSSNARSSPAVFEYGLEFVGHHTICGSATEKRRNLFGLIACQSTTNWRHLKDQFRRLNIVIVLSKLLNNFVGEGPLAARVSQRRRLPLGSFNIHGNVERGLHWLFFFLLSVTGKVPLLRKRVVDVVGDEFTSISRAGF